MEKKNTISKENGYTVNGLTMQFYSKILPPFFGSKHYELWIIQFTDNLLTLQGVNSGQLISNNNTKIYRDAYFLSWIHNNITKLKSSEKYLIVFRY